MFNPNTLINYVNNTIPLFSSDESSYDLILLYYDCPQLWITKLNNRKLYLCCYLNDTYTLVNFYKLPIKWKLYYYLTNIFKIKWCC